MIQAHFNISLPHPPAIQFGILFQEIERGSFEESVHYPKCERLFLTHTHTLKKQIEALHEKNREPNKLLISS